MLIQLGLSAAAEKPLLKQIFGWGSGPSTQKGGQGGQAPPPPQAQVAQGAAPPPPPPSPHGGGAQGAAPPPPPGQPQGGISPSARLQAATFNSLVKSAETLLRAIQRIPPGGVPSYNLLKRAQQTLEDLSKAYGPLSKLAPDIQSQLDLAAAVATTVPSKAAQIKSQLSSPPGRSMIDVLEEIKEFVGPAKKGAKTVSPYAGIGIPADILKSVGAETPYFSAALSLFRNAITQAFRVVDKAARDPAKYAGEVTTAIEYMESAWRGLRENAQKLAVQPPRTAGEARLRWDEALKALQAEAEKIINEYDPRLAVVEAEKQKLLKGRPVAGLNKREYRRFERLERLSRTLSQQRENELRKAFRSIGAPTFLAIQAGQTIYERLLPAMQKLTDALKQLQEAAKQENPQPNEDLLTQLQAERTLLNLQTAPDVMSRLEAAIQEMEQARLAAARRHAAFATAESFGGLLGLGGLVRGVRGLLFGGGGGGGGGGGVGGILAGGEGLPKWFGPAMGSALALWAVIDLFKQVAPYALSTTSLAQSLRVSPWGVYNTVPLSRAVMGGFAQSQELVQAMTITQAISGLRAGGTKTWAFALRDATAAAEFARAMGLTIEQGGEILGIGQLVGAVTPGNAAAWLSKVGAAAIASGMTGQAFVQGLQQLLTATYGQTLPTGLPNLLSGVSALGNAFGIVGLRGSNAAATISALNQAVVSGQMLSGLPGPVSYLTMSALLGRPPSSVLDIYRSYEQGITSAPQFARLMTVMRAVYRAGQIPLLDQMLASVGGAGGLLGTQLENKLFSLPNRQFQQVMNEFLSGRVSAQYRSLYSEMVQRYSASPAHDIVTLLEDIKKILQAIYADIDPILRPIVYLVNAISGLFSAFSAGWNTVSGTSAFYAKLFTPSPVLASVSSSLTNRVADFYSRRISQTVQQGQDYLSSASKAIWSFLKSLLPQPSPSTVQEEAARAAYLANNPSVQAAIGIAPIAAAYREAVSKGLKGSALGEYVLTHSGHPTTRGLAYLWAVNSGAARRVIQFAQQFAGKNVQPEYFAAAFRKAGVPGWVAAMVESFEGNVAPNQMVQDTGGAPSVGPLQLYTGPGGQGAVKVPKAYSTLAHQYAAKNPQASAYQLGRAVQRAAIQYGRSGN
jgi:hypothetical protein